MKYYKLIQDNQIIGVISSKNFVSFSTFGQCFVRKDEQTGEYISYNGKLYRAMWMTPITYFIEYIEIQALEITLEAYNIYLEAIYNNEVIENDEEEEELIPSEIILDPTEINSIEYIRTSKINEMSYTCRKTIENGFDMEIRGEIRHFSLTAQDQLNLMSLNQMAQEQELIPYHADGEESMFYTAEEIRQIITNANSFKTYHLSYYNSLKTYINTLDTIEDIAAITYGTPIPDEYKSDVLKVLE